MFLLNASIACWPNLNWRCYPLLFVCCSIFYLRQDAKLWANAHLNYYLCEYFLHTFLGKRKVMHLTTLQLDVVKILSSDVAKASFKSLSMVCSKWTSIVACTSATTSFVLTLCIFDNPCICMISLLAQSTSWRRFLFFSILTTLLFYILLADLK